MWTAVRRPLLLAFVFGCVVSLAACGRVTLRLIVDGAVSFAFVPIVEAMAFAVVGLSGAGGSFGERLDRFFATNAPWLFVLAGLAALCVIVPPIDLGVWLVLPRAWLLIAIAVCAIAWSALLDVAFFRDVLRLPPAAAIRRAIVFRLIAWPAAVLYFFGFAIWPLAVAWMHR
jgi:hypothetical protein